MLQELFEYNYLIKSGIAALLGSITAGIAGTYIVSRRMVFLSGGITHASFGGIGLGYFFGFNPVIAAAIFGASSALSIEYLSKHHNLKEDSAIGFLWAFGMAIGIIFIYLTPGYSPNLMSYLFGSILTISNFELIALFILTIVLIAFFAFYYRTILYIAFDEVYARTFTNKVDIFKYILIILVSLVIVLNIRIAGVVLVLSLLTIPPNIALLFTKNFMRAMFGSVLLGFFGTIIGLVASWFLDIPTGAAVIFALVLLWLLCSLGIGIIKRKNLSPPF